MSEVILSNQNGVLTKIDAVNNGRQKYELTDKKNNNKTYYSVAEKDVFEFEKTYKEGVEYISSLNADEIKARSENINKADLTKKIKIAAYTGGFLGAAIPAIGTALLKTTKIKWLIGVPVAISGALIGFMSGVYAASKKFMNKTVPELKQLNEFGNRMNKLDVKVETPPTNSLN